MEIYKAGSNFTVKSSSKVIVQNALRFRRGRKVVGALDAVYDFKDLPPSLHALALQLIDRSQTIMLPV